MAGDADLGLRLDRIVGESASAHGQGHEQRDSMDKVHSHGGHNRQPCPSVSGTSKGRSHGLAPSLTTSRCVRLSRTRYASQSTVKAMMLLPRLKSIWTLPPAPTTMYGLPSTELEAGGALTSAPAKNDHNTSPVLAS